MKPFRVCMSLYYEDTEDYYVWASEHDTRQEAEHAMNLCRAAPELLEKAERALRTLKALECRKGSQGEHVCNELQSAIKAATEDHAKS